MIPVMSFLASYWYIWCIIWLISSFRLALEEMIGLWTACVFMSIGQYDDIVRTSSKIGKYVWLVSTVLLASSILSAIALLFIGHVSVR